MVVDAYGRRVPLRTQYLEPQDRPGRPKQINNLRQLSAGCESNDNPLSEPIIPSLQNTIPTRGPSVQAITPRAPPLQNIVTRGPIIQNVAPRIVPVAEPLRKPIVNISWMNEDSMNIERARNINDNLRSHVMREENASKKLSNHYNNSTDITQFVNQHNNDTNPNGLLDSRVSNNMIAKALSNIVRSPDASTPPVASSTSGLVSSSQYQNFSPSVYPSHTINGVDGVVPKHPDKRVIPTDLNDKQIAYCLKKGDMSSFRVWDPPTPFKGSPYEFPTAPHMTDPWRSTGTCGFHTDPYHPDTTRLPRYFLRDAQGGLVSHEKRAGAAPPEDFPDWWPSRIGSEVSPGELTGMAFKGQWDRRRKRELTLGRSSSHRVASPSPSSTFEPCECTGTRCECEMIKPEVIEIKDESEAQTSLADIPSRSGNVGFSQEFVLPDPNGFEFQSYKSKLKQSWGFNQP